MKRKKSLLAEVLIVATAMILLPSLLSFAYFYHTVPAKMELQAEANADFYIDQTEKSVSEFMELARDVAFNIIADDTLQESMQNPSVSLTQSGRSALLSSVGSAISFLPDGSGRVLNAVYLFRDDGQFVSYSSHGSYVQEQRRIQQIYQETIQLTSAQTLYCPESGDKDKTYFILDYKNTDTLEHLGKLVIELNTDVLIGSDDLMQLYPDTCLTLTGSSGELLYTLGENLTGLLEEPELNRSETEEYIKSSRSGMEEEYYHVNRRIGNYQMQLDIFIPLRSIYGPVWETSRLYLTFGLLILMATLVFGLLAYCRLLRPLRGMEKTLNRLAKSDYTARMPQTDYRELAQLQEAFNRMADNLDASFRDAYQKGIQLQESESRLLAAQINPHFVFNVLETINMRCVDAGLKEISHMVTDLAQLLRGNIGIGSGNQKITFGQELKYVQYYLELQQSRFGENLSYSVEYADEELLEYRLPRLTIQPLVENAIVHGLEPRRGLGWVKVRIWEEDSSVYVRIEDNGVGFAPDQLNLSEEEALSVRHNHIALPNILRRLRLFYGDLASLEIHSVPEAGTTVLLIIPIDRKED